MRQVLKLACGVGVLAVVGAVSLAGVSARPATSGRLQTGPPVAEPIRNASFEESTGDVPAGWRRSPFQGKAEQTLDSVAHSGTKGARISSVDGADAAWSVIAAVTPFSRYRLSGWIKTESLRPGTSRGALLNLHGLAGAETKAVSGTTDWTRVEIEFDSGPNDGVQVNCLFGGFGKAVGTAWFDDIRLERLSTRELKPAVVIDAARTKPEMSKYIYGQFIEHLGRCINGGIWAEMLEDRKFYYAVGSKESPWAAVGDPGRVRMSREQPFVGEQTPEILAAGGSTAGIRQGRLALVDGKKYTGRVVLAGDSEVAPVRVSLVWGDGPGARRTVTVASVSSAFTTTPITFVAGASSGEAALEITSEGAGTLRIGTVSLMPADNVQGFRPDVLQLLRELDAPVYRWPGGNFVSGYNWRDGIGDRDRRPPRKNPAWQGIEPNDVGIHEFMALCELIKSEPYIAVNSGLGDVAAAADQVEYVNGAVSSPMGMLRAANGHPAPYRCRFWSIGNEMYGDWQLGHMPIGDYVKKHVTFAEAMRAKDPAIRLIAVGDVGPWDDAMLAGASRHMDLISEHFYVQEAPGLMGHVALVPRQIRRIAEAHRKYRQAIPALSGTDIRIALDEWNYWYGPHVYGELGTQYFLKDALGIAAGLHEYLRQSDIIYMANYAQTVNVIGAIKTSKTAAVLDTTGQVLKLYRARFGTIPIEVSGAPEPLDVAAAWRADRKVLTIGIVNPTKSAQRLSLGAAGIAVPAEVRAWRITGADERSRNVPGEPLQVAIEELKRAPFGASIDVPPMSATIYELPRKQ